MGGNVSKETEQNSVAAFTYRGFGCARCCSLSEFFEGAPTNTCCGTSCGSVHFELPIPTQDKNLWQDFQADLPAAAEMAQEHISTWSYIFCTQFDTTSARAAQILNQSWCAKWNENRLHTAGYHCAASSEVYGFGRSRVTYLVIRIVAYHK